MSTELKPPTQPLKGITHKEVQKIMDIKNVPVSVACMFEILQWCQQRTLEWVAETEDAQRRALAAQAEVNKEKSA